MNGPSESAPSDAIVRLSAIDIGSISPSVLRSSGTSAMPTSRLFACSGRSWPHRSPVDRDCAVDAAQHAEQREQQGLLALSVESAEADDLASADSSEIPSRRFSQPSRSTSSAVGRLGALGFGRILGRDVASDHQLHDLRRSYGRPWRMFRCDGRCGTPRRDRPAPRPRACGARCRGWRHSAPSAAPAAHKPSRRRRW